MKSRIFACLTIILMLGFILAACAPQATPTPQEKIVTQQVEKIVTQQVEKIVTQQVEVTRQVQGKVQPITYVSGLTGNDIAFNQKIVDAWNTAHPDMPVQVTNMQNEDLKQAVRGLVQANPAPDVVWWSAGNRARFFIDKNLIFDLSAMWNKDLDKTFAPAFKALATTNGKQYFVPSNYDWWSIWYRKSVFEKNGVSVPKTWDDLMKACDTFNSKGIAPISIGTRFKWPAAAWFDYIDMRLNGLAFHTQVTDLKIPYTDPKVKKVFEYWKQAFVHKCFIANSAAYDWQETVPQLVDGTAGMYLMGSFITTVAPKESLADMDFFQFPIIDPNVPVGEDAPSDGFMMPAKSLNNKG